MDSGITITPEKPLTLRYLLVSHRGGCDPVAANATAKAFAARPPFEVGKRGTRHHLWEVWRKTTQAQRTPDYDYWIPKFVRGGDGAAPTALKAKLGGWPWGFPVSLWPTCRGCGHAMCHLAQLPHVPEILDLGSEDAVLHVFQCEVNPGICGAREHDSEASVAILMKRSELGSGLTRPPEKGQLIREFQLTGWKRQFAPNYFEHKLVNAKSCYTDAYYKVSQDVISQVFDHDFKAGGLPHWTGQTPRGFPEPPFEFLAQFGSSVPMSGEVREPHEHKWANLGSDGNGYLYINRTATPPEVRWYWSR